MTNQRSGPQPGEKVTLADPTGRPYRVVIIKLFPGHFEWRTVRRPPEWGISHYNEIISQ